MQSSRVGKKLVVGADSPPSRFFLALLFVQKNSVIRGWPQRQLMQSGLKIGRLYQQKMPPPKRVAAFLVYLWRQTIQNAMQCYRIKEAEAKFC